MADDNVELLIDEWGESNVEAAFWLSQHIKNTGLDGIEYMEAARGHLESTKRLTVQSKMESQMDNEY